MKRDARHCAAPAVFVGTFLEIGKIRTASRNRTRLRRRVAVLQYRAYVRA
jgi:hypothetical protein